MNRIRVEIGGIGFLLRYKNYQIKEDEINELNIRDFIQPGENDFIIDIEVGILPECSKDRILFQAKENWRSYIYNGYYIFETYQSHRNKRKERITRICIMEKNLLKAKVYIAPDADITDEAVDVKTDKTWSLEQLMRIMGQLIAISILHRYQGLLIHSAGIIFNGQGMLFSGVSRAGKTTLAKLWQKKDGITVLSDDRVIVRREKEGYFVYGSPWPGEGKTVSCQKAPLKKIFFLSKAHRNRLTPIEKKESLQQLITQCFPAIWDKESADFSLRFCGELVEKIPCFSFGFVPDESAVEFIEERCSMLDS